MAQSNTHVSESSRLTPYASALISTAIENNILMFGSFTLKSGRTSPYFYNAGLLHSGQLLTSIGSAYASAIHTAHLDFDTLFGPAYKGISLAAVTAVELNRLDPKRYGQVGFTYNRKEVKDHGEGGMVVGATLENKKVLILDDVITAGTAIREAITIIQQHGGQVCGVVVNLDRQETGKVGQRSAIQEVEAEFGFKVVTVLTMTDIIEYMKSKGGKDAEVVAMEAYRSQWGIKDVK